MSCPSPGKIRAVSALLSTAVETQHAGLWFQIWEITSLKKTSTTKEQIEMKLDEKADELAKEGTDAGRGRISCHSVDHQAVKERSVRVDEFAEHFHAQMEEWEDIDDLFRQRRK